MSKKPKPRPPAPTELEDEPGAEERFDAVVKKVMSSKPKKKPGR